MTRARHGLWLAAGLGLAACEGSLTLQLTDAPVDDVAAVHVQISGVTLHNSDGTSVTVSIDKPKDIVLSDLRDGLTATLLSEEDVPAGDYTGLTLGLDADSQTLDSYVEEDDGAEISLLASGGSLRVNTGFEIRRDENTHLTLDFDLRQSLLSSRNGVDDQLLRPVLRLIETDKGYSLTGGVDLSWLDAESCDNGADGDIGNVVYLFNGRNARIDDIDGLVPEPLATTTIARSSSSARYAFHFLPEGDYTLALSCRGRLDDPSLDDALSFDTTLSVSLSENTTADFDRAQ